MIVSISGVGGSGKTAVSEELVKRLNKKIKTRKEKYKLIPLNNLAKKTKAYSGYDEKRKSKIVKLGKLKTEFKKLAKKHENVIIEGHFAHFFKADITIILRCNPTVLERRLKKKYDWPTKITENIEAEMINLITDESIPIHKLGTVFEIDTSKKTKIQTAKVIEDIIEGKGMKYSAGKIDWLKNMS